MKEEKKITQSDIDQATVRLHPIAGVEPRVYLPAVYAILAIFLLFLALILPGIRKNGSYLVFEGTPAKSAVYVGDLYKGSSGQKIFLPSGDYAIRFEREGFAPETRNLHIGGRLFGSLFFPRREKIEFSLSAEKPAELLLSAYREYASWSLAGKPSALYQFPPVLSDAAAALAGSGALAGGRATSGAEGAGAAAVADAEGAPAALPAPLGFARDALSATASAESARDGLKASILVSSGGIPGPLSMVSAARVAIAALCVEKAGAVWLRDILDKDSSASMPLATTAKGAGEALAQVGEGKIRPKGEVFLGGHEFVLFSGGALPLGGEAPSGSNAGYSAVIPSFGMARTEVTNRQWATFLAANPSWRPDSKAALVEAGLADEFYLDGWKGSGADADKPVTNVSWAAASAYCDWLNAGSRGAWKAVLPSEGMWEAAARAGLSSPDATTEIKATWSDAAKDGPTRAGAAGYSTAGLADMFGNVWEWTAEAYRPYPAFADGRLAGDEKTVRGGSWANASDSITLFSRGGMPSAHATSFLGFRPAIVER
ncbi:MAG TPA: formylglycine-generating enzyme family protein [Rectinemataceae bacterium]|nr:formylglycine-generating enzyme family protein [Rectinemataceae bacterium]